MFRTQWPVARLSQLLTDVQPGFARDPGDGDVGIAQLRTNNVDRNGELCLESVKRVEASEAECAKYSVTPGDVIFNNTNSPELVGKTAFFDLDDNWVLSNHMTRLRVYPEVVDPKFLARVLHFYWGMGFSGRRGKQWVNQAAVDARAISTFPIPLPTLSEQQRIVEILNEARDIRRLRQQAEDITTELTPAIFHEMFATDDGFTHWPELPIKKVVESADYGTSTAANEDGVGIPILRMNNVTYQGELDLSDLKHIELSAKELEKHRLRPNDVLFNRTNSAELVGKTGLWDGQFEAVAASYFVRVRLDQEQVDPKYFVAFLNLPSTKRRLQNMAKHAIGMSNINATELQRIRVPMPPIELQQEFGRRIDELNDCKAMLGASTEIKTRLTQSLLAHAFSGELTSDWREDNREALEQEAAERDEWLLEAGVKLVVADTKIEVNAKEPDNRFAELNREQQELLSQLQSLELDDSAGTFTLSTLTDSLVEPLDKLPVAIVRRHLDVLAARGLVKSLSRRAGAGGSIDIAFGNAYRLPKNDNQAAKTDSEPDEARMSELDRLSRQGRVFHESVSDELSFSDSAVASVTKNKGDE